MNQALPRILIVAGSDSGGGAGIQADIKTVTCNGGYAMTALAALTAQNTLGVQGILDIPDGFISQQMESVLSDIGADAIKTGMLHRAPVMRMVMEAHRRYLPEGPLVVDPVMVAKGGARLLKPDAEACLREELLPYASVITPNLPEAEALTGLSVTSLSHMRHAAEKLLSMGAKAVVLKGGHLEGDTLTDLLVTPEGEWRFEGARVETRHTHGTGCTLASAITVYLAKGASLQYAVEKSRNYVLEAMRTAPGLGKGHGPLNHYLPHI